MNAKHTPDDDRHERGEPIPERGEPIDPEKVQPERQLVPLFTPRADLFNFENVELVRLDRLAFPPGWRAHVHEHDAASIIDANAGYGLGEHLNSMLGGGIGRGEIAALGASGPGAGKTHVGGQCVEGLALRTAEMRRDPDKWAATSRTLTPIISLSEMAQQTTLSRAVARYTGLDGNVFRQGRHWEGYVIGDDGKSHKIDSRQAQRIANEAVRPNGALAELSTWLQCLPLEYGTSPIEVVESVKREVAQVVRELRRKGMPSGLDIVPLVFVDPLQRYQGTDDELRALNTLIEALAVVAKNEGFAVLCTSDTNKDSSTGAAGGRARDEKGARERGAKFQRGSNKVQHLVDSSLYLERDWDFKHPDFGEIELVISKNRNGSSSPPYARFRWHFETGRMFACTRDYARKRADEINSGASDPSPKPPIRASPRNRSDAPSDGVEQPSIEGRTPLWRP